MHGPKWVVKFDADRPNTLPADWPSSSDHAFSANGGMGSSVLPSLDLNQNYTGDCKRHTAEHDARLLVVINYLQAFPVFLPQVRGLKGIYAPAGLTLDAYHIDSVNTCYD